MAKYFAGKTNDGKYCLMNLEEKTLGAWNDLGVAAIIASDKINKKLKNISFEVPEDSINSVKKMSQGEIDEFKKIVIRTHNRNSKR